MAPALGALLLLTLIAGAGAAILGALVLGAGAAGVSVILANLTAGRQMREIRR